MKFRVEVVCISDDGQEHRSDVLEMERRQLAMETLGLTLCESKAMVERLQDFVVARQTAEDLEQRRGCQNCGRHYTAKGGGTITVKTCLERWRWPTRVGIAAVVSRTAPSHSGLRRLGCTALPVRSCCTWRTSGHR